MKNGYYYKQYFKNNTELLNTPLLCEDNKYRLIYKICFPDGKYYIGKHKTKDYNDGYNGSGKLLPREYSKQGVNNCKKIILGFYKTDYDLSQNEKMLIGDLFLTDGKCLNCMYGGDGGFTEEMINKSAKKRKGKKRSKESIEKQRKKCIGKTHTQEEKNKISLWHKNFFNTEEGKIKKQIIADTQRKRIRTEEERKKMSITRKKKALDVFLKNIENENYEDAFSYAKNHRKDIIVKKILENEKFYTFFYKKTHKDNPIKNGWHFTRTKENIEKIRKSRIGIKASDETRKKMSEQRKGRGNSRYIPNKIKMYDLDNNLIQIFNDCIEASEYIKKYINPKATTNEIFVACRTGKTRYKHKWEKEDS